MEDYKVKTNAYLTSGRIPHGFLFCGADNSGGETVINYAKRLAATYLCKKSVTEPCGVCTSCVKASANFHPDIIIVKEQMPDEKYKLEPLRNVISAGIMRPNDGELRVYILRDLHEMTPLCQNALLKFIEEPSDFNRFIFTAETTSGILETIVSRLVKVDFTLETGYTAIDEAVQNITRKIINSLVSRDEYGVASAFSLLGDREKQKTALLLILSVFRDGLIYKNGSDNLSGFYREGARSLASVTGNRSFAAALERVSGFIEKMNFNPNTKLAAAIYASEIYDDICGT